MALGRPVPVDRSLDFEPVNHDTRPLILRRPAAQLPHGQAAPIQRRRVEHDRLERVDPSCDLVLTRLERRRREGAQQPAPLLLLSLLVSPKRGGLRRNRRDLALIPLHAPDRQPHPISARIDGRDVQGRLEAGAVRRQQAD